MKPEIILIIVASIVLVLSIIVLFFVLKKKNPKKIKVDEEFINTLVNGLGGINNVLSVNVDNGRLKFGVEDLEVVQLETLKSLSTTGIFVTGNTIKMLFTYDAATIQKAINQLRKGA